ncbi:transcriptional repressor [Helicobacter didelphidarum]|uniref:Transcriptional repressor n=1 Tax=Helicobacter didelphidarum TaxID=2040648 RepID=A0A3D8ILE0_9HELI|nr:transcriptional repressor [Helicobacter didelphidarum]
MVNFEKELKIKKLKVTPQRVTILKEIAEYGHASIDDIYERIKKTYPSISLATIYKNVTILCQFNVLSEIKVPGYKQKYELNREKHVHIVCDQCGKLEDIYIDFSALEQDCQKNSGYNIHRFSAIFMGICPECEKVNSRESNNHFITANNHKQWCHN